jgi:hypothetical protein
MTRQGRWIIERRRVTRLPDLTRRTPVVDPDDHHLYASVILPHMAVVLASMYLSFAFRPWLQSERTT